MKNLNKEQLKVLRAIRKVVEAERFKADQIKGNTSLLYNGQELSKEYSGVATLMENTEKNILANILTKLGYEQGKNYAVDLETGVVTKQDE
jgi:exonuclease III